MMSVTSCHSSGVNSSFNLGFSPHLALTCWPSRSTWTVRISVSRGSFDLEDGFRGEASPATMCAFLGEVDESRNASYCDGLLRRVSNDPEVSRPLRSCSGGISCHQVPAPSGVAVPLSRNLFGGEDCLSEASSAAQAIGTGAKAPLGPRPGANGFGSFCRNKRTSSCGGDTPHEKNKDACSPQALVSRPALRLESRH